MILQNSKGLERHFEILFEVEKGNEKYMVYKDPLNDSIYGGKYKNEKLLILKDEEIEYLNKLLERLDG